MLCENREGHYSFLPGSARYSAGVIASPGYEIVHTTLLKPLPLRKGFDAIAKQLEAQGRLRTALCAVELRCPRPYTFAGFSAFNESYQALLKKWGIPMNVLNPLARTNVSPAASGVSEPELYAFSYTAPLAGRRRYKSFIVSGGGEAAESQLGPAGVLRFGETSQDALREKVAFVLNTMRERLDALGASWSEVTAVDVYTVHNICPLVPGLILGGVGPASRHALRWYVARPPIKGIEYGMDLHGVRNERYI
jgi:hypothetical protein